VTPKDFSAALRATTLPQGRGALYDAITGRACALGAAALQVGIAHISDADQSDNPGDRLIVNDYAGHSRMVAIAKQFGLSASKIVCWNDEDGLSFTQIADRIDKEFPS
jgi:hypothetical protein